MRIIVRILLFPVKVARWAGRHPWHSLSVLVVLGLAAYLVFFATAGNALDRELKALRAAGEPVTPLEAAPKPVPDAINAVLDYQRFSQYPHNWGKAQWVIMSPRPSPWQASQAEWKELEAFIARSQPAIACLEQGASKPKCRFPADYREGLYSSSFTLIPVYSRMREAARVLMAKAYLEAHLGQTRQALSTIATMVRISNHVLQEPSGIAQLVGYACQAIALATPRKDLAVMSPDQADAKRLADLLANIDLREPLVRAMKMERASTLLTFDQARHDPDAYEQLAPDSRQGWLRRALWFLRRPSLYDDEVSYLRVMRGYLAVCRQPYRKIYRRLDRLQASIPSSAVLAKELAETDPIIMAKRDETAARLGLARWGLAISIYRSRKGRWPATLAEVRREVAWDLPADPFTGREFRYRLIPGGYLLYSVGQDFHDDGGKEQQLKDIAWRVTRSP